MSVLDEINESISNGKLYKTYRILRLDKSYDNKPGVLVECTLCNRTKRVRYSNLKNGYTKECKCLTGDTSKDKRDYLSYLGMEYQGWRIEKMEKLGNNYKEGHATIRCVKCNCTEVVKSYNLVSKIDDNKNIRKCSNCKKLKDKLIQYNKIQIFKNNYIGINYRDDTIVDVICKDLNTLDKCIIKCSKCGRLRDVIINDFINHHDRHITRCECEASGWNTYSPLIGKVIFGDEILDYKYEKDGKAYRKYFVVRCTKCGTERNIDAVSAVVRNSKLEQRPKDFGYKICNCNPGTRSKDVLDRYKQYIGKKIEGTKLTVIGLELKDCNNGKKKVMARTICDCSPDKVNLQWLPAILNGRTVSCGCALMEAMKNNSLYCNDKFIGKIYDDLEVIGVRQTNTGGILWECKCLLCNK